MVRNQCLHVDHPYNPSDANLWAQVVENIVKIPKSRTGPLESVPAQAHAFAGATLKL